LAKRFVYIFFIVLLGFQAKGQDPHFSQFYANPLYLGPSFAGATEGSRVAAQYRNQWYDQPSSFKTYSVSYDHYFSSFNSGVGVNFVSDVAGSSNLGVVQAGLHYSYNVQVFNIWQIRPGLSFSYLQHGIFGDVKFIDEIDGPDVPGSTPAPALASARDIDAGASLLTYTKGFWLGGTVDHLLRPNVSLYSTEAIIPMKISIYGGIDVRRKGKLLKPSDDVMTFAFLYKQQGPVQQLDIGVYWHNYPIVLGIWYRGIPGFNSQIGDALIFLAGIKTNSFNIGYSYDFTISSLLPYTRGSHEISLTYKFLLPKRKSIGAVPCPEF
jgi:type IX secretion system PorP/SprF family membrane protein